MRRLVSAFAVVAWWAAGSVAIAQSGAAGDSARAALEAELDQLLEHLEPVEHVDPFETGRSPDLIVASTATVLGEIAPCG